MDEAPVCLTHNAHLGKILSFSKFLDKKITHLTKNFDKYICLISSVVIQAWYSQVKTTYTLLHKIVCIS